ncbi:unnamed protein product [Hapterophycus canaliculatus]
MEPRSSSCVAGDPFLSIALTLLSTDGGGFEEGDVAPVAAVAALDFLSSPLRAPSRFPGLRVVLTAEEGSSALAALRQHVPGLADAGSESRLLVKSCSLPDVSKAGVPCAYLVNPCNWRLVAGGARTNVLVNRAAGDCLQQGSLKGGRKRASVAEPIPVKLSPESPLRAQGVDTVIQVLGPNLDSRFPGCLSDEPERARLLLRQCYDKAFDTFWEMALLSLSADATFSASAATPVPAAAAAGDEGGGGGGGGGGVGGGATGHGGCGGGGDDAATIKVVNFPEYRKALPAPVVAGNGPGGSGGHWKTALFQYLKDVPRRADLQNEVYFEDGQCVVVYDGYPKSKYHLLLLPKPKFLDVKLASALRRDEHLPSLRQLHATGAAIAEALSQQGAGEVRCGYHGIPSLQPLHLHIISQDFSSARMTKRKHWNSFTTGKHFFLEHSWVEARLEELGSLNLDKDSRLKALEETPLRCFRCGQKMVNMTKLKEHNLTCAAPSPRLASAPR